MIHFVITAGLFMFAVVVLIETAPFWMAAGAVVLAGIAALIPLLALLALAGYFETGATGGLAALFVWGVSCFFFVAWQIDRAQRKRLNEHRERLNRRDAYETSLFGFTTSCRVIPSQN